MMDLTPLDVRKKKGDFRRGIRGYEQAQVDDFLDLVADRMEALVRQASSVGDRIARLEQQVADYRDREKALTEALVTAQQMREDIRTQSTREVELLRKQAEQDAERIRAEAVRARDREEQALEGLRSRQFQFLASYRKYLEQELSELTAMTHGLEMHAAGGRGMTGHPGPAQPTPQRFEPPTGAAGHASPATADRSYPDASAPAGTMTPPAAETAVARPATPAVPVPFEVSAPADQQATRHTAASPETEQEAPAFSPPSSRPDARPVHSETRSPVRPTDPPAAIREAEADASEAQLEEALARWEPELGPGPEARAAVPVATEDDADPDIESEPPAGLEFESELELESMVDAGLDLEPELELESTVEADLELESELGLESELELESTDGDDLFLSSDDEVSPASSPSSTVVVEPEDDVDLAFLEFGEDDVAPAVDPAVAAAAAAAVEREVSAALVDSHGEYIDIGTALGDDRDEIELPVDAVADEIELPVDAIADEVEPAVDEAEAAIDAAFDFDEVEPARVNESPAAGPAGAEPPGAQAQGAMEDDDRAADIAFVDSLLADESMFGEAPSEEGPDRGPRATGEMGDDPFGDDGFDGIAAEDEGTDDYGREDEEKGEADPDLIDLDAFRGFSTYEPPAPTKGDVSSLTLHPMFFEQEPSDLDGGEEEESRQDHWSSSGGG